MVSRSPSNGSSSPRSNNHIASRFLGSCIPGLLPWESEDRSQPVWENISTGIMLCCKWIPGFHKSCAGSLLTPVEAKLPDPHCKAWEHWKPKPDCELILHSPPLSSKEKTMEWKRSELWLASACKGVQRTIGATDRETWVSLQPAKSNISVM